MNRLECEIIAWKNVTNPVIDSQANTIPGIRANLLVRLVDVPVNLPVEPTELGQGGAGALGSRDLSIPCPLWACTGAPDQLQGTTCRVAPRQLIWGLAQGPRARTPGVGEEKRKRTATPLRLSVDFSDFLGIRTGSLVRRSCYLCRSCY